MMENIVILLLRMSTEFTNIGLVYKTIFDATFTNNWKRTIAVIFQLFVFMYCVFFCLA